MRTAASEAAALFLFTLLLSAQPSIDLCGRVTDPAGGAIDGASVRLLDASSRPLCRTVTGIEGTFACPAMIPGEVKLEVSKPGWQTREIVLSIGEGQPAPIQAGLEPETPRFAVSIVEDAPLTVAHSAAATRTATRLLDIPQSVAVIPAQLLKQQAALSMQDALKNASGVSIHMGEGRRDQVYIRGFTAVNDQYVDGVRDDAAYYRDLSNIEQVAVLKGPGSVLFGRGSAGGIINRITKRPDPERPIGEFSITAGSYGVKRVTGDLGQAYLSGKLAWRLTGAGEDSGSHRDRFFLRRHTFAPSLAFRPGSDTLLLFQAEHLDDQRLPDRGIPALGALPAPVRAGSYYGYAPEDFLRNRVTSAALTLDHRFPNNLNLHNTFRHAGYLGTFSNTYPNGLRASGGSWLVNRSQYNSTQDQQNTFNQTDLVSSFRLLGMQHRLLTGLEFGAQSRRTWRFNGAAAAVDLFQPVLTRPLYGATPANNNRFDGQTTGVYVQDQIGLAPGWKLLAGVRGDRYAQTLTDFLPGKPNLRRIDKVWSPRVGLVYQPRPWTSFYGSVSRSFQPSGEGLSLAANNAELEPESTVNKEAGNKSEFFGGRIQATLAAFDLQRRNVKTADPVDFNRLILAGRQRTRGAELSLAGELSRRIQIYGGYAFLDTRILESNDTASGVRIQGKRLGHIPLHSANLWSNLRVTDRFGVGLGVTYAGERFTANDNLVSMPAYVRVDAALFWRTAHSDVALNLRNIANAGYYESAHGTGTIMPGAPVSGVLTLRYRW